MNEGALSIDSLILDFWSSLKIVIENLSDKDFAY